MQQIINKRIKLYADFTYNSNFKRTISYLNDLNDWKSNQLFQFSFFVFPIVFQNILNEQVYEHFLLNLYILMKLWNDGLSDNEIIEIQRLIKIYTEKIELYYEKDDLTLNVHLLSHLVITYVNFGPLKYNNAFIYEHLNGYIKRLVTGGNCVLEQIAEKLEIYLKNELMQSKKKDDKYFRFKNKTNRNVICKNDLEITASESNKTIKHDFYIRTADNQFYKVLRFLEKDDQIFFIGQKFRNYGSFDFKININELSEINLKLDYIFKVELLDDLYFLNANVIEERVSFSLMFKEKTAETFNCKTGYVIRNLLEIYN